MKLLQNLDELISEVMQEIKVFTEYQRHLVIVYVKICSICHRGLTTN